MSTLKLLAQKAKKRLSTAGQSIGTTSEKTVYLNSVEYAIVASKQRTEDDPLFEKVKKLVSQEDVLNPISELTDYSVFNKLSSVEKEKYVIDISNRYNEIRKYFINE